MICHPQKLERRISRGEICPSSLISFEKDGQLLAEGGLIKVVDSACVYTTLVSVIFVLKVDILFCYGSTFRLHFTAT